MIKRIIKSIVKFLISLFVFAYIFSIIVKNYSILELFYNNLIALHIYRYLSFILSAIIAIDFKYIKNDIKEIVKRCNEFDKTIFARLKKRPIK